MDFSQHTVLIIDDDQTYRTLLKQVISLHLKSKVVEAENPKIAFDYLNQHIPSLIILDMQMPVMDGLTVLKYIRKVPSTKNVPVIPCTAMSNTNLVMQLGKLGISDYIVKTTDIHIILEKIQHTLAELNAPKSDNI